jgi:RNA polymerase sigma factor (TIGR02999 family)
MDQTVTALLHEVKAGNNEAFNRLYESVYNELRQIASNVRFPDQAETYNTTALVHEAYFKLIPAGDQNWENKNHFFRVAARAMRQVLIKQARFKKTGKRGGGIPNIRFDEELFPISDVISNEILALDQALTKLEKIDERQAKIVECRFFAGMSVKETAETFGVSPETVKRDWRLARAWLIRELESRNL